MLNLWPDTDRIELEAHNPERNVARWYTIAVVTDLFGMAVVETAWGRIGTVGRTRRQLVGGVDAARSLALKHMKRRASAHRRLGVAYTPLDAGGRHFVAHVKIGDLRPCDNRHRRWRQSRSAQDVQVEQVQLTLCWQQVEGTNSVSGRMAL